MKTLKITLAVWFLVTSGLQVQAQRVPPGDDAPFAAMARSAHETLWQQVEWHTNQLGEVTAQTA